jgi:hypothetical protein
MKTKAEKRIEIAKDVLKQVYFIYLNKSNSFNLFILVS